MAALTGLEKFSHLEDKIYRTIEMCKSLRQQRDLIEKEAEQLRSDIKIVAEEKERLNEQIERLLAERDEIRSKVESMLDAIAIIDPEPTETVVK